MGKINAPNYHVHEYWPREGAEQAASEENADSLKHFKEFGSWDESKFHASYHYPHFDDSPFPEWTKHLSQELMLMFCEVYSAKRNGLVTLALIGIRSIIDLYVIKKVGDIGGFEKKLKALLNEHHISVAQSDALSVLVEGGNAAVHRGYRSKRQDVEQCMEILLIFTYLRDTKTALPVSRMQ